MRRSYGIAAAVGLALATGAATFWFQSRFSERETAVKGELGHRVQRARTVASEAAAHAAQTAARLPSEVTNRVRALIAAEGDKPESDRFFERVAALTTHPEAAWLLLPEMLKPQVTDNQLVTLAGALGSEAGLASQLVLIRVVESGDLSKAMAVFPHLLTVRTPRPEATRELWALAREFPPGTLRDNCELALSGQLRRLRGSPVSDEIATWFAEKHSRASTTEEKTQSIDVLGNSGHPRLEPLVLASTSDGNVNLRARAALALRFQNSPTARATLRATRGPIGTPTGRLACGPDRVGASGRICKIALSSCCCPGSLGEAGSDAP